MNFKDVIISNIPNLTFSELLEIQKAINNQLGGNDVKKEAARIKKEENILMAVKFVRDKTGWNLVECKEFCDIL